MESLVGRIVHKMCIHSPESICLIPQYGHPRVALKSSRRDRNCSIEADIPACLAYGITVQYLSLLYALLQTELASNQWPFAI